MYKMIELDFGSGGSQDGVRNRFILGQDINTDSVSVTFRSIKSLHKPDSEAELAKVYGRMYYSSLLVNNTSQQITYEDKNYVDIPHDSISAATFNFQIDGTFKAGDILTFVAATDSWCNSLGGISTESPFGLDTMEGSLFYWHIPHDCVVSFQGFPEPVWQQDENINDGFPYLINNIPTPYPFQNFKLYKKINQETYVPVKTLYRYVKQTGEYGIKKIYLPTILTKTKQEEENN